MQWRELYNRIGIVMVPVFQFRLGPDEKQMRRIWEKPKDLCLKMVLLVCNFLCDGC